MDVDNNKKETDTLVADGDKHKLSDANKANLKKLALMHGAALSAALTLFGAAYSWAQLTSWPIAVISAIAMAFFSARAIAALLHEWGHWLGTFLSGAKHQVFETPKDLFFIFNFDMANNSTKQFLWMSWGGLGVSLLLPILAINLITLDAWASVAFAATLAGIAVNVAIFELPIALNTASSGQAEQELTKRFNEVGVPSLPGLVVGVLLFLLLI